MNALNAASQITLDINKSKSALIKELYKEHGIKENQEVFDILTANGVSVTKAVVSSQMWAIRTPEDSVGRSRSRTNNSPYKEELTRLIIEGNSNTEAWSALHNWAEKNGKEPKNRKWVCDTAWAIRKKLDEEGQKVDKKGQPMLPAKR